jgi:S1/P1 Nuclease
VKKRSIIIVLFALMLTNKAMAWGKHGHKIIAQIAKSQVKKDVADLVSHYLKGISWEEAACWMDEVKAQGGKDYMHDWHYVNVAKDKTYVKSKNPDVVNQLEFYLQVLKNRKIYSSDAIFEALKIVFHLVGDMTQPLHCGYADDRGGTNTHLKFLDRPSTLHKIWDSEIIEERRIDIWACSKKMMAFTAKERKDMLNPDLMFWLNDARLHLKDAYSFKDGLADKDYVDRNTTVIEIQLVKAGLRLAAILSADFK